MPTVMDVDYFRPGKICMRPTTRGSSRRRHRDHSYWCSVYKHYTLAKWHFYVYGRPITGWSLLYRQSCQTSWRRRRSSEAFKTTGLLDGKKGLDLEATLRPTSEELAEEVRRTVSLYGAVPSEEGDGLKMIFLSGAAPSWLACASCSKSE